MPSYPISEKIVSIMDALEWSQEETARHFMVDPATITRWKQGRAPQARLIRWHIDRWEIITAAMKYMESDYDLDDFVKWMNDRF